jgi:hypothetical protein
LPCYGLDDAAAIADFVLAHAVDLAALGTD